MSGSFPATPRAARWALCLTLVGLAFLPASAAGSTAEVTFGTLEYDAGAGETNNLTLSRQGANLVFTDTGATITPMSGCAPVNPNQVSCAAADIDAVDVSLSDMGDRFTVAGSIPLPCCSGVDAFGGTGPDVLTTGLGNSFQEFFGEDGADTLNGNAESDRLSGGPDSDVLNGNGDGDQLEGNGGNDVQNGGEGHDSFSDFSSTASLPDGADVFNGGPGIDRMSHFNRDAAVTVDLDGVADDGAGCPGPGCEGDNVMPDVENIDGGEGNDVLVGNGAANGLAGSEGDDQLSGLGGADSLAGADGDDVLGGGAGADDLQGRDGADRLLGGRGDDFLAAEALDLAADVYSGGRGTDEVDFLGQEQNGSLVYGGIHFPLRVSLDGKANDGTVSPLISGPKDNTMADLEDIVGGEGSDVLIGNKRANEIEGGDGNDRIVGLGGPDGLFGEHGNDSLTGGKGRDLLDGAGGADRLTSRDKKPDEVRCGSATDRVKGDRADRVAPDCDKRRLR